MAKNLWTKKMMVANDPKISSRWETTNQFYLFPPEKSDSREQSAAKKQWNGMLGQRFWPSSFSCEKVKWREAFERDVFLAPITQSEVFSRRKARFSCSSFVLWWKSWFLLFNGSVRLRCAKITRDLRLEIRAKKRRNVNWHQLFFVVLQYLSWCYFK